MTSECSSEEKLEAKIRIVLQDYYKYLVRAEGSYLSFKFVVFNIDYNCFFLSFIQSFPTCLGLNSPYIDIYKQVQCIYQLDIVRIQDLFGGHFVTIPE